MTQSNYNFICMVKRFKTLYGFQCASIYLFCCFGLGFFKAQCVWQPQHQHGLSDMTCHEGLQE